MISSESQYTKLRWIWTVIGLVLYAVDVGTDIVLGITYFIAGDFVWSGLTLLFMLLGALSTQIFSYAWYRDDMGNVLINPHGNSRISGMSKCVLTLLHSSGMGVFTRSVPEKEMYCTCYLKGHRVPKSSKEYAMTEMG